MRLLFAFQAHQQLNVEESAEEATKLLISTVLKSSVTIHIRLIAHNIMSVFSEAHFLSPVLADLCTGTAWKENKITVFAKLYFFFSHELQTCDWPRNVGCDASGGDAGTISTIRVTDPRTKSPPQQRTSNNPQQSKQNQQGRVSQREEAQRQRQNQDIAQVCYFFFFFFKF